jgi:uroporphyrinogen-III synthase
MNKEQSDIYILSDKKIKGAKNLPLLQISYLKPQIDILKYDALIFTSKNALLAVENLDSSWINIPSYAISEQTAKQILSYGGNLVFTGQSGHGNQFAKELIDHLQGKNVLYIKARKVVSDLENILKQNNIAIHSVNLYETTCKKNAQTVSFKSNSYFVFSSPSTIECFFKNYKWDDSFTAVCIGNTTKSYLPKDIKYLLSEKTSLESCVQTAKEDMLLA